MLFLVTLITIFSMISALEPSCITCKHFLPNQNRNPDFGFCKAFKNTCVYKGAEVSLPNYASHCRNNENLCGKTGFLYEVLNIEKEEKNYNAIETNIQNELNELKNRCCGEVNEKDEIEQLERDFFEIFQKIKNHNKKKIYKTTKDLYKLFKRDNKV